jgi:hypothetical protein
MTSRERFHETLNFGKPDRVPYFEEGIRKEVIKKWRKQGLGAAEELSRMFPTDRREEIITEVDPLPPFKKLPMAINDLVVLKKRLNPNDSGRLPHFWKRRIKKWHNRDYVLMLRVHRGFFLSLGVGDWARFEEIIMLLRDNPDFISEYMRIQGNFAAQLAEKILKEVEIDAAIFSEPIGGADRPLLSPQMYEKFVLRSYLPVLDVLRRNAVNTIILLTYANFRALIPSILKFGINCLWACETNIKEMDYRDIRREFGRSLSLIGGIDLDALRKDKAAIRKEIEEKVPPLLASGGYIPLADGRIREDVPYQNYIYYRKLLREVTKV